MSTWYQRILKAQVCVLVSGKRIRLLNLKWKTQVNLTGTSWPVNCEECHAAGWRCLLSLMIFDSVLFCHVFCSICSMTINTPKILCVN